MGNHALKDCSKTQVLIALSSGESELCFTLKASAEMLGIIVMLNDFGLNAGGEIWGDAQAAFGINTRNGFGKTRHAVARIL